MTVGLRFSRCENFSGSSRNGLQKWIQTVCCLNFPSPIQCFNSIYICSTHSTFHYCIYCFPAAGTFQDLRGTGPRNGMLFVSLSFHREFNSFQFDIPDVLDTFTFHYCIYVEGIKYTVTSNRAIVIKSSIIYLLLCSQNLINSFPIN